MVKRFGVLGMVTALLALLVGAVSPAFGSSSGGSASKSTGDATGHTIRVIAVFQETAEIDVGAPGFSLGDEVVFAGDLRQAGERVGRVGVVCTFTSAADPSMVQAQCPATADLPGGQITLQGLVTNRDLRVLPITGGSGRYQGAEGEMFARFLSQTKAVLTFHLED
jgi:Allene oxide cyclase barrel like domain